MDEWNVRIIHIRSEFLNEKCPDYENLINKNDFLINFHDPVSNTETVWYMIYDRTIGSRPGSKIVTNSWLSMRRQLARIDTTYLYWHTCKHENKEKITRYNACINYVVEMIYLWLRNILTYNYWKKVMNTAYL